MTVSIDRISEALRPMGYNVYLDCTTNGDARFVRRSRIPDVFQSVQISFQGRRNELVHGDVGVCIAWTAFTKRIGDSQYLRELADPPNSLDPIVNGARLRSPGAVAAWERRFLELAPPAADRFAAQAGPRILEETAALREAVRSYLRHVPDTSMREAEGILRSKLSPTLREAAAELAQARVRFDTDAQRFACPVAAHLVMLCSEGTDLEHYANVIPPADVRLVDRLYVLNDWIAHRPRAEWGRAMWAVNQAP